MRGPLLPRPLEPDPCLGLPAIDWESIDRWRALFRPLVGYHRVTLEGVENVPQTGRVLMAVHHSLATYDGFLLGGLLLEAVRRPIYGLGDDRLFEVAPVARLMRGWGVLPASPEAGARVLEAEQLLAVAPGGMWESLRPSREARTSRWGKRRGYARLALRTGSPVMCAAMPAADDIFRVRASRMTDAIYRRIHWPVPVFRGIGPTLIPRPVKLTGRFAPVVVPPPHDPEREAEQIEQLHTDVSAAMARLMTRGS